MFQVSYRAFFDHCGDRSTEKMENVNLRAGKRTKLKYGKRMDRQIDTFY